jgi:uncharacterized protein (DUF488 family)
MTRTSTKEEERPSEPVFSLGHSNHPLETFLGLLKQHRIELLVDVRSSPYSGYAPHFNHDPLRDALRAEGLRYLFLGDALGGQPGEERFYDAAGHVCYDRLAQAPPFQAGIERVIDLAAGCRLALLCGEEDPTDCHRRLLVGRVLGQRGLAVAHIRGDGRIQSEAEVARECRFRKTKGQMTLFELEDPEQWKSTRSVSPKPARASSSDD